MAKKAKTTAENKAVKASESTVYVGKSRLGLSQYTVFKNGVLPSHIEKMCKENENIRGLIVPVSKLQEARNDVKKVGHKLNVYAQKLTNKEV